MKSPEKILHNRMKIKGTAPTRSQMIEAAIDAHRVFTLMIHLNCNPENDTARGQLAQLLAKTDTDQRIWQQPYEQRRALERKGGVKNYV